MGPSFSVVIPAHNASKTIVRAMSSIISQTYRNWELIVINDGSTDDTQDIVSTAMHNVEKGKVRMFILPENHGRMAARNLGMKMARNEWLCMLDADDEYTLNYLECVADEIERDGGAHDVYNFGMLVKEREVVDGKRYEKGFRIVEPLHLKTVDGVCESFDKGRIGMGSFVWRRSLMKEIGYYPETLVPYGGDDSFPALLVKKNSIFEEICKKNEEGQWLPLGNPWGDDYVLYWFLTRYRVPKTIDTILYIAHIRV